MLGDVHTICGYLIAKYLYEVNLSKSAPNSTRILPQSRFHLPSSSASSAGSEAAKFLCGGKLEQKYVLCGMILSNLPDLDVLLTPFFGGFHQFHRTLTHSIYGYVDIDNDHSHTLFLLSQFFCVHKKLFSF